MTHKDFLAAEKTRATVFNIFTALLCQPEKELADDPIVFDTLIDALKIACPECVSSATLMKKAIKDYAPLDLLVEYTRLFIGPAKMMAPPYSSLYFGSEYTLMNDETYWVMNFYERMGLRYDEKIKDVPDHVAIETEFLYYMIFLETKAFQKKDLKKAKRTWRNQSEFFNKHYKKWVPEFCKKITENTKSEYYKLLAECFSKFVTSAEIPEFPKAIRKNARK